MANFDDRLDDAINRMMAGKTLPEDAELRDLLTPAQALMDAPVPAPAQRTARMRMNAALDARRGCGLFGFLPRWLSVAQLASAVVAVVMIAVVALASMALPGQPLYTLKQGSETVLERVQRSPDDQARYYVRMANRHLGEMERLAATGRPVTAAELARFRDDWQKATVIPGVDPAVWQQDAWDQARRLQALIDYVPMALRDEAASLVAMLVRLADRGPLPMPTPGSPAPPTTTPPPALLPPGEAATKTPTSTEMPAAGTPAITSTPITTPAATPSPAQTHTPSPTRRPTNPPGSPTDTPVPTHTPAPPTVTHPPSTHTPKPTRTPDHDGDHGGKDGGSDDFSKNSMLMQLPPPLA
jgi:hypothetical protein